MTQLLMKGLEGKTMSPKNPTAKKPATPPPPPSPLMATVIGKFPIGGKMCELLCVHKKNGEPRIGSKTLFERGDYNNASMSKTDCEFMRQNENQIPEKIPSSIPDAKDVILSQYVLVFPLWNDNNVIRTLDKKGVSWWCTVDHPDIDEWDTTCLLIRFRPLQSA